ncbi:MAG TPA: non-canonical purine NTP pyrophosphatase, partial [bacterium]|nr:non-canonical purine NTP pyrophosphatase [bacterium]
KERKAKFITIAALIIDGEEKIFKGEVNGFITFVARGTNGFGYDPVFEIPGIGRTFAELTMEEKNRISHRAIAFRKLADYLLKR